MKLSRRRLFSLARDSVVLTTALTGFHFIFRSASAAIPADINKRLEHTYALREKLARKQGLLQVPNHINNGDEARYPELFSCFSKGLPHNHIGDVDKKAYKKLLHAFSTGKPEDFETVPVGGPRLLANPQGAIALQLEGADSHHLSMPPAPEFASEEQAAEMAELYWHALCRDIPTSLFDKEKQTIAAISDLKQFDRFKDIDSTRLFRGETPGDRVGPYFSQFLWKTIPYGAHEILQKYNSPRIGENFMVKPEICLQIQNGAYAQEDLRFETSTRYIRTGRDIGEWVHIDYPYQGFLNAALILLSYGDNALQLDHPYRDSKTQAGFVTLGGPDILSAVAHASNAALKAAWYQKWLVHRRLRPEAFALCVHNHITGRKEYPIHQKLLECDAIKQVHNKTGFYTLPMAYPEGSPTHPSYPAGHAVIAGACMTVLKAYFNEDFVIPDPVEAYDNGFTIREYRGPDLRVGDELNKLASNISIGRDFAGLHWRSDATEGMKLGEDVTIRLLQDRKETYNESFTYQFTRLDGTKVII
ncbi:MAG: vanadium-dependent haloperoxidase [Gammaproteobacteria bacterium]